VQDLSRTFRRGTGDPRQLNVHQVERDVRGDIGEHLRFEDDRYSGGSARGGWSRPGVS